MSTTGIVKGIAPDPCPVEAVFGPDDRVPCLLDRGHDGQHQYTPEPCAQCGCLPDDAEDCGCDDENCPCSGLARKDT